MTDGYDNTREAAYEESAYGWLDRLSLEDPDLQVRFDRDSKGRDVWTVKESGVGHISTCRRLPDELLPPQLQRFLERCLSYPGKVVECPDEHVEALGAAIMRVGARKSERELDEQVDRLHGPGAAEALSKAYAEGHFDDPPTSPEPEPHTAARLLHDEGFFEHLDDGVEHRDLLYDTAIAAVEAILPMVLPPTSYTTECSFPDADSLGAEATADYCYTHQRFCLQQEEPKTLETPLTVWFDAGGTGHVWRVRGGPPGTWNGFHAAVEGPVPDELLALLREHLADSLAVVECTAVSGIELHKARQRIVYDEDV